MGSSVAKGIKKGSILSLEKMEGSRLLMLPQSQVLLFFTQLSQAECSP